jgi:chitin synthase
MLILTIRLQQHMGNFITLSNNANQYKFLPATIADIFKTRPGQDITSDADKAFRGLSTDKQQQVSACLQNNFYYGKVDFRDSPRCKVQNYILITFAGIVAATILAKCE